MCSFFTIKPNRTFHSEKKSELFIAVWGITTKKEGAEKPGEDQSTKSKGQRSDSLLIILHQGCWRVRPHTPQVPRSPLVSVLKETTSFPLPSLVHPQTLPSPFPHAFLCLLQLPAWLMVRFPSNLLRTIIFFPSSVPLYSLSLRCFGNPLKLILY